MINPLKFWGRTKESQVEAALATVVLVAWMSVAMLIIMFLVFLRILLVFDSDNSLNFMGIKVSRHKTATIQKDYKLFDEF